MSTVRVLYRHRRGYLLIVLVVEVLSAGVGVVLGSTSRLPAVATALTFWDVLLNNLAVGALVSGLGLLSFGMGGLFVLGYNLLILGYSCAGLYNAQGVRPILMGIAPHAFPELAAMTLCGVAGFEGWRVVSVLKARIVSGVKESLRLWDLARVLAMATALYVVAAGIEATVSHV